MAGETAKRKNTIQLDEGILDRIEKAFIACDEDGSGALSEEELQNMWRMVFPDMKLMDLRAMSDSLYMDLDPNRDGCVSLAEFKAYFRGVDEKDMSEIDKIVHALYVHRAPTVKEIMWLIMDMGTIQYKDISCWVDPCKYAVALLSNVTNLVAIYVLIVETLPQHHRAAEQCNSTPLEGLCLVETVCIILFTIEYVLRLFSAPSLAYFISSGWTYVDLLAICPWYIGVALTGKDGKELIAIRIIRIFRLLRLLRILKFGVRMEAVQVLFISLARTITALLVSMVAVNTIGIILFASLVCTAERHQASFDDGRQEWIRDNDSVYPDAGESIQFQSIPSGMWWSLVTLTTVGYGDMSPSTGPGKLVASLAMLLGLIIMAFPLTLLASSFGSAMQELAEKKAAKKRAESFASHLDKIQHGGEVSSKDFRRAAPPPFKLGSGPPKHALTSSPQPEEQPCGSQETAEHSRQSQESLLVKDTDIPGKDAEVKKGVDNAEAIVRTSSFDVIYGRTASQCKPATTAWFGGNLRNPLDAGGSGMKTTTSESFGPLVETGAAAAAQAPSSVHPALESVRRDTSAAMELKQSVDALTRMIHALNDKVDSQQKAIGALSEKFDVLSCGAPCQPPACTESVCP